MNIARLNRKITIQKSTTHFDIYGNHVARWDEFYSCHATVSNKDTVASGEKDVAGNTVDRSGISVTIRYTRKLGELNSTGYRALLDGEAYNIIGIDRMSYKNKSIKLKCHKVRE